MKLDHTWHGPIKATKQLVKDKLAHHISICQFYDPSCGYSVDLFYIPLKSLFEISVLDTNRSKYDQTHYATMDDAVLFYNTTVMKYLKNKNKQV